MKKILVVDDEAYFADMIKGTLDPSKYTVATAVDGEDGLKMIEQISPDAVLLDINMPKMNGLEMLKELNAKGNKIPIIVTSNLSSKDIISEGMELGVRGYIIKSDELPSTLAETIENLFK